MSKNIKLLIGEHCPDLLCGICQDILDEPIQVHCPEDHMFCSHCIQKHIETESSCPLCFTALARDSFQLSKFAQRQISRLRIKCVYHVNGCPWQGLIADRHAETCEYAPCVCPNADKGCTESNLNNVNIQQHVEQCPFQLMSCPNNMPLCQPFFKKDLQKHESECVSYTCPYTHEGCSFIGTLNQVNIHCESYCGKLHKSIQELTEQISSLNSLIQNLSLGLQYKESLTPAKIDDSEEKNKDTSMNEMALFHDMFNNNLFDSLNLSSTTSNQDVGNAFSSSSPIQEEPIEDMLNLDFLNTISTDSFKLNSQPESSAPSPQPLEFIPPATVPKRTTNGKKIRYSKNVRLAHSAMRMARERTSSVKNSLDDDVLNNLDVGKQKNGQLTFKHTAHVNKLLDEDIKKEKKKSAPSLKPTEALSSTQNALGPKRRPMFILASSYLSNYASNSPEA